MIDKRIFSVFDIENNARKIPVVAESTIAFALEGEILDEPRSYLPVQPWALLLQRSAPCLHKGAVPEKQLSTNLFITSVISAEPQHV